MNKGGHHRSTSSSHATYLKRSREIEALSLPAQVTVAILSSFTADLLRPYLVVEGYNVGLPLKPWFGPFGQFEQILLNDHSALWSESPDMIWIMLRIEDIEPYLLDKFAELGPEVTHNHLRTIRERVVALAKTAREKSRLPLLIANFHLPGRYLGNPFDASDPNGLVHQLAEENRMLASEFAQVSDVHLFDYAGLVAEQGGTHWADPKLWYMARMGISANNQVVMAKNMVRLMAAVLRPPAKCLVVDLDNTLWGGVLGDDGPEAIKIGDDYPGNIFKDLQAALLGYYHKGFLLAIASKNEEELVRKTLDGHPEMLLRTEHFADIKANWRPKHDNLREIAKTLNIGVDSLVYIDDNPVERAQVCAELPEVCVVDLPADPIGYLSVIRATMALDRPRLLQEDRQRAFMYRNELERRQLKKSITTLEDFLISLEMSTRMGRCGPTTIDRIHQLILKTNQLNLTSRRYSLDEIKFFMDSPEHEVVWMRLTDRYGDMGLICVGIVSKVDVHLSEIDTFLMSCRVMDRKVEIAFLSYLARVAAEHGAKRLRGVYRKTAKNKPVQSFYPDCGFIEVGRNENGEWLYEKDITAGGFLWPEVIKRQDNAE